MGVMVVVEALAARDPGEESPVGRRVVVVPATTPVAERVDQGREHEDIQDCMQESGNEAGPEADQHTERAQADGEAEDTAGEEHPIEAIGPEVRSKRLESHGV